jgi:hypothetical protein
METFNPREFKARKNKLPVLDDYKRLGLRRHIPEFAPQTWSMVMNHFGSWLFILWVKYKVLSRKSPFQTKKFGILKR